MIASRTGIPVSERRRRLISAITRTPDITATPNRLMKPTAAIINTSRGPIIDGAALLAALRNGQIAEAGIDVYDNEPLAVDHPLRSEPRAILTPHLGYVTEETYRLFYGGTVSAIEGWLAGTPINQITV